MLYKYGLFKVLLQNCRNTKRFIITVSKNKEVEKLIIS